jgi:hypothetical protein
LPKCRVGCLITTRLKVSMKPWGARFSSCGVGRRALANVGRKATALQHAFAMHSDSPGWSIYVQRATAISAATYMCDAGYKAEASKGISAGEAVLDGFGEEHEGTGLAS